MVNKKASMEKLRSLIGTKANVAQWARIFTQETRLSWPESERNLITDGEDGVFYGILWEEFRSIRQVVIQWEGKPPKPNEVELENWVSKEQGMNLSTGTTRTTWWVGSWHPFGIPPEIQGNRWVFEPLSYQEGNYFTACKLRLRSLAREKKPFRVRSLEVFAEPIWSSLRVELEWGFDPESTSCKYDGRIEIYNGIIGSVNPLESGGSTKMSGPREWRSEIKKGRNGRHGVIVELLYMEEPTNDAEVLVPHVLSSLIYPFSNRTILTIRTESGNCSFLVDDLKSDCPILVADLGLFAVKHGTGFVAKDVLNKQRLGKLKTFRQRIAEMPEQTWKAISAEFAEKMAESKVYYGSFAFTPSGPNYSKKGQIGEYLSSMKISVPEPRMNEAWKRGATHIRAPCKERADGTYDVPDAPYPTIAQECCTIFSALDAMGFHKIVRQAIAGWLVKQGMSKPFGKFKTKKGCLILDGYDNHHSVGPGLLLVAIADHYQMTGDKKWLEQVKPHVQACCSWILRERKWAMKSAPDGTKAWAYGLQPPCCIGDSVEWRPWYILNIYYYFGLLRCGNVFVDIDHKFSKKLLWQAEEYRNDILAAVERSATLTPVRRIQDGTYRRTIPPMPYSRRMRFDADPREKSFPCIDVCFGAIHLVYTGLLGLYDRLTESMIDVLEDNILVDVVNGKNLSGDKEGFVVDKDWFHYGGKGWINGVFILPEIYLYRDDIKHFLRGFWNSYAAHTDLKSYRMREVPNWQWVGKILETARFLTRLRNLLIMEENQKLWIARATPRSWLQDGNEIKVSAAPTFFGEVSYTITSYVNKGKICATIEMPKRSLPEEVFVRFRHPQGLPIKGVKVNGQEWKDFDVDREVIILRDKKGHLTLEADYDIIGR